MNLEDIRKKIDHIDEQIVELYEQRMEISKEVAEFKIATKKPVFDKEREIQKINAVKALTHNEFNTQGIEELFWQIMSISRKLQYQLINSDLKEDKENYKLLDKIEKEKVRVVFQGAEGAYSQAAMLTYFGENIDTSHVDTFKEAIQCVDEGKVDFAVVPLENSTAGAVVDTYDLLVEFDVCIVGEQILNIEHCVLGLAETKLEEVERVYAHPQALMQSKSFLQEKKWKQISMDNNAFAAQKIAQDKDLYQVAIASELAGKIYGLKILEKGVNSEKNNATKFVVLAKSKVYEKEANIVSVCFEIANESGSLYKILSHFMFNQLNLTKIESRPIAGENWGYRFFLDIEGNLDDDGMKNALQGLKAETSSFKILGNYVSMR